MKVTFRNFIFTTVEKRSGSSKPLPDLFWPLFTAFNFVHSCWYVEQRVRVWKPANFLMLAQGVALKLTVGDVKAVQFMAKVAEAAMHLLRCADDVRRIKENSFRLHELMTNTHKVPMKIDLQKVARRPILTASTHLYIEEKKCIFMERSKRIAQCTYTLLSDIYLLSMHTKDLHVALEGHDFQVVEFGVYLEEVIDKVLLNAALVDDILQGLDVPWSVKDFVELNEAEEKKLGPQLMGEDEVYYEEAPIKIFLSEPEDTTLKLNDLAREPGKRVMIGDDIIGGNVGIKSKIRRVLTKKTEEIKPLPIISQITIKKTLTPV